jgi:hypothetical protein
LGGMGNEFGSALRYTISRDWLEVENGTRVMVLKSVEDLIC